ncbi:MAG: 2-5 ligase family protein [Chitinophagaceae bacterium]|nr:2-5 ligase family protein [Chitinophagaceae bacterium]
MKKQFVAAPKIPGYKACEYLLVLSPHEDLWNRVMKVKEEFAKEYECPMAFGSKPHITLVKFTQYEMAETRIVNRIKMIAMSMPAFKVDIQNFGSFPSHTIYFEVVTKVAITNMVKELKQVQQLMTINKDNKPYFNTEPNLTLARKLLPWQFEKGWLEYSHKHFTASFIAKDLQLLKRAEGQKGYSKLNCFQLMNLAVVTTQGELFSQQK